MNALTHQVCVEALRHVGVHEVGHNDGPEVAAWLARVNRAPGNPWCAAFAWCMLDDACRALGIHLPLPPTAGVHLLCERAKATSAWTDDPGPGFVALHDSGGSLGHCGIVLDVDQDTIEGIEGNTNEAGSREGDHVAKKRRPAAYWSLGYLDPTRLFGVNLAERLAAKTQPGDL